MTSALLAHGPPRRSTIAISVVVAVLALVVAGLAALVPASSAAAGPEPYGFWVDDEAPTGTTDSETRDVTLGTRFSSSEAGQVTGVQFHRSRRDDGPYNVYLAETDGTVLAKTEVSADAQGWVTAPFTRPVAIEADTRYVASYRARSGRYTAEVGALSPSDPLKRGSLTAWQGQYAYPGEPTRAAWRDSQYFVGPVFTPTAPAPTPTPTPTVPPVPEPTMPPQTQGTWPGPDNTGVPSGTTLTDYRGPMTITRANTVIDAARIDGRLVIAAPGVVVSRSRINGNVDVDADNVSVRIVDSEIDAGSSSAPAVGYTSVTVLRTEIVGGQHSVLCGDDCVVQDSWLHDQALPSGASWHNNAYLSNGGSRVRIVHNTLSCTPRNNSADGGCSSDLSLFADFAPITDVEVRKNYFTASPGGYCATFGDNPSKRYGTRTSGVTVVDNVFERGDGRCATFGPVTSYTSAGGGTWSGNTWVDGGVVTP